MLFGLTFNEVGDMSFLLVTECIDRTEFEGHVSIRRHATAREPRPAPIVGIFDKTLEGILHSLCFVGRFWFRRHKFLLFLVDDLVWNKFPDDLELAHYTTE